MEQRIYVKDREGNTYIACMTDQDLIWYHYLVKQLTAEGVKTSFDEMVLHFFPAVQKVPADAVPAEEGRQ